MDNFRPCSFPGRTIGAMVTAKPLPEDLAKLPFTVYQARALGVAPKRLHAKDMVGAGRLIRAHAGRDVSLVDRARVLCAATPDAWVSHETAATFFDLGLPPWLGQEPGIHLSKPHGLPRVRRAGVVGHRVHVIPGEVVEIDGISVSGPPRTWLDLAHQLPLRYPNMKGVEKARLALDEMRVGSDSFPETFLRLALRDGACLNPNCSSVSIPTMRGRPRPTLVIESTGSRCSTTARITDRGNSSLAITVVTNFSSMPGGPISSRTRTTSPTVFRSSSPGSNGLAAPRATLGHFSPDNRCFLGEK